MATFQDLPEEVQNSTDPDMFVMFYGHFEKEGDRFKRHVFSQFYPARFTDEEGNSYRCAEDWMMRQKAILMGDRVTAKEISELGQDTTDEEFFKQKIPHQFKALGRKIGRGGRPGRWDQEKWDRHKSELVFQGNLMKFSQNPDLKRILLATGNRVLVEAAGNDAIWGIGLNRRDVDLRDKSEWGENRLGCALMRVRESF